MTDPTAEQTDLATWWPKQPASKPTQSMGRWIDNLLGDKRIREEAAREVEPRRRWLEKVLAASDD